MNALVVLKRKGALGVKVMVELHTKSLRKEVVLLLKQGKKREALSLIISKALVKACIPEGSEPDIKPDLILEEEI